VAPGCAFLPRAQGEMGSAPSAGHFGWRPVPLCKPQSPPRRVSFETMKPTTTCTGYGKRRFECWELWTTGFTGCDITVCAQDGKPKAGFFLDPYSRPAEKRGGAWMAEVVGQVRWLWARCGAPLVGLPAVCFLTCQDGELGVVGVQLRVEGRVPFEVGLVIVSLQVAEAKRCMQFD
jgi:hypothetical protein